MKRALGVCYYPEHWPQNIWAEDIRRMAEAGLTWVRIGEFAWSRLEAKPGQYDFDWLDAVIDTIGQAGLKVILGTPTAAPPRWMIDRHPDMLAIDAQGLPRKFGSRRHYCFSHQGYRDECQRIVTILAERYGSNPTIAAWQTDNEYGCHNTTLSYSVAAQGAFRDWLQKTYGDIAKLNQAWGNVFWSMEYDTFEQIDLPNLTVAEANPAHALAFRRFSSDQVVSFNRIQVEAIRAKTDAPITHNYMGKVTDFDHFEVGQDLDIASWDSYPLGFLEDRIVADESHKQRFARQGDPDFQAFHHDLYRAVGRGRWWILEQQPGPVNWGQYNPAPLLGMVRLWSWEAFAHGAEAVCYFRWRQAPMAQEQMHAGLLRPDSTDTPALTEIRQVIAELVDAPDVMPAQAKVALLFDYAADYAWAIQPHGAGLCYFDLVFDVYRAMRALGLSIDILPATTQDFTGYKVIAAPGLMHMPKSLKEALSQADATIILGPRTATKDWNMCIPIPLPPDFPALDITVSQTESLHPSNRLAIDGGGYVIGYREYLEGQAESIETTHDGEVVVVAQGNVTYVGGWLDQEVWRRVIQRACDHAGVKVLALPAGVRVRETANERFWFNYDTETHTLDGLTLQPISVHRESNR